MLKGHLSTVIHHQEYWYTKIMCSQFYCQNMVDKMRHAATAGQAPDAGRRLLAQGYLAHKQQSLPPGPPLGPRHWLTVRSWGGRGLMREILLCTAMIANCPHSASQHCIQRERPLSSEHGTHQTVKARFWPWHIYDSQGQTLALTFR